MSLQNQTLTSLQHATNTNKTKKPKAMSSHKHNSVNRLLISSPVARLLGAGGQASPPPPKAKNSAAPTKPPTYFSRPCFLGLLPVLESLYCASELLPGDVPRPLRRVPDQWGRCCCCSCCCGCCYSWMGGKESERSMNVCRFLGMSAGMCAEKQSPPLN